MYGANLASQAQSPRPDTVTHRGHGFRGLRRWRSDRRPHGCSCNADGCSSHTGPADSGASAPCTHGDSGASDSCAGDSHAGASCADEHQRASADEYAGAPHANPHAQLGGKELRRDLERVVRGLG